MQAQAQPWFREFDGWWYVQLRRSGKRKQVKLVKGLDNKDAAFLAWHALMSQPENCERPLVVAITQSVAALLDVYLDHVQKNLSDNTYRIYQHLLESFGRFIGRTLAIDQLKPFHVTNWLNSQTDWSSSTKNGAVQTVRTAFRWLAEQGLISFSPVAGVRGPAKRGRETILSDDEFIALLAKVADREFRDVLEFLWHTGARPQEVRAVETRHVNLRLNRIVFPASQSKGKRAPRVIYLDERAAAIVAPLCEVWPAGAIFRNRRGRPWTKDAINCRFMRLEKKLGVRFCLYHLRHSFATNALQRLDPITVSTLMGHLDPSTLARTYQHLAKNPKYLLDAARKATAASV